MYITMKRSKGNATRTEGREDDWQKGANAWTVTLTVEGDGAERSMVVEFWTGTAIKDGPTAHGVLECLLSDAGGLENARGFEDWCGDYGYDTDSRKALAIYEAIRTQTEKLRHLLGDHFQDAVFPEDGDTEAAAVRLTRIPQRHDNYGDPVY